MGGNTPNPKTGLYIGGWGNFGIPTPMKGVTTYSLSPNRQRPFAGALHNAFFNTFRRCKGQVLYVVPPFILAYVVMDWGVQQNEYYNSKPGRMEEEARAAAAQ